MNLRDKNGKLIPVGVKVRLPEPDRTFFDDWTHSIEGTVQGYFFETITVLGVDGLIYHIEPERLEVI